MSKRPMSHRSSLDGELAYSIFKEVKLMEPLKKRQRDKSRKISFRQANQIKRTKCLSLRI